jgi:two-component system, LytTR family, response regulator
MKDLKKMKCLIIDSDKKSRESLHAKLESLVQFSVLNSCKSFKDAVKVNSGNEAEVIFFDVLCMNKADGDMLTTIAKGCPHLVMTADKKEDAIHAFNMETVDFILKPVSELRLAKTFKRILRNETKLPGKDRKQKDVFLRKGYNYIKISLKDIIMIEAQPDSRLTIHTTTEKYSMGGSLNKIMEKLPEDEFMRVHKSFIIRLDKVDSIENDVMEVEHRKIRISPVQKQALLERLNLI